MAQAGNGYQAMREFASMSGAEYIAALDALGLTRRSACPVLGISERTSYGYGGERTPVPQATAMLLRYAVRMGLRLADLHAVKPVKIAS